MPALRAARLRPPRSGGEEHGPETASHIRWPESPVRRYLGPDARSGRMEQAPPRMRWRGPPDLTAWTC